MIQEKCAITRYFRAGSGLLLALAMALAGCKPTGETPAAVPTVAPPPARLCGDTGELRARLYGAISVELDWNSDELECNGMPRPEGNGARLRFAGQLPDVDKRIALIVAIPGLQRGIAGAEYATRVTVIEEGGGRFFSTSSLNNCLTDVTTLEKLDENGDRFRIGGTLYCVSPLAEVNGPSSLSIDRMQFSGLLDWSAS
jgi:hypothetical protein